MTGQRIVHFVLVVLLIALHPAVFATHSLAQENEKVLKFPTDRSMGVVYVGPKIDTPYDEAKRSSHFQRLATAQGDVVVPADALIRLDVSLDAVSDLSPLAKLPSDAVHNLYFNIDAPLQGQLQHIQHFTEVRWLRLRSCPITDDDFQHLARMRKLEYLQCSVYGFAEDGYGITDKSLEMFRKFSKLKVLSLRDNPITDEGLEWLSRCDSLETLALDGTAVTGQGLEHLLILPNLRSLSFGAYEKGAPIDDEGMKVLGQLVQLEHLDLSGTDITDEGMEYVSSLQNLESLTLDYTDVTDEGLVHLAELENLRRLRFHQENGRLTDRAAEHLSQVKSLEKISASWELSSEGVESIAQLRNLKSFRFGRGVTDANMEAIGKMTSLEDFSIQNCPVTDVGISKLENLNNLERLIIHGTRATPACLTTFLKLPKLNNLHMSLEQSGDAPYLWPTDDWNRLSEFKQLEYFTVDGLLLDKRHWEQLGKLTKLKFLEVRNLVPLGKEFFQMVSKLESLEMLEVEHVDNTASESFDGLAKLTKLGFIRIRGPIDDGALMKLASIPNLNRLHLMTSEALSEKAIAEFKTKAKSLQGFSHRQYESERFGVSKDGIIVHRHPKLNDAVDAMIGEKAPKLTLEGLPVGNELNLSRYSGKVVLVHFWSAYTVGREPRPDEVHVRDVVKNFEGRNLQVIGIHPSDLAPRMEPFIKEQGISWPCFVDDARQSAADWNTGGRRNRIYLIDREGKIRMAQVYQGDLQNALELVLKEDEEKANLDR